MSYQIISGHIYTLYYFLNTLNMFFTLHLLYIYISDITYVNAETCTYSYIAYIYILCYSILKHIVYKLYVYCFYSVQFTYIEFVWRVHNIMYISVHLLTYIHTYTYIYIYLRIIYHISPAVLWSRMFLSSSCGFPFTAI
jgi:hypothetical protein